MKKYGKSVIGALIILMLVVTCAIWIKATFAEPLDTYHAAWVEVHDVATEDGATFAASLALATSAGNYANMPDDAYQVTSRGNPSQPYTASAGGAWMFVFGGATTDGDDDNETFSFTMVGWAKANGMAQVICEGDGVIGTQDIVTYPNGDSADANDCWADTINLDETTKWPSVATYNASGDNEVANLVVDLTGLEYIEFFTYDVAGSSEATSLGIYGRPY